MLEQQLLLWLTDIADCRTFYQHLAAAPGNRFVWFIRNGDDSAEGLDDSGEPDTVYFDLEIYDDDLQRIQQTSKDLRLANGFRGRLVPAQDSYVDDVEISDQADDYQPRASAETLPAYSATFRLSVTGYGEG